MTKKTGTQKIIEDAVSAAFEKAAGAHVSNCSFIGVNWDAKAVEAILSISRGIEENARACANNARALGSLADVLKASNVTIETMLKLEGVK